MIRILCVGKIKESFFRSAIDEYMKRLSKYTKIDVVEIDDVFDNNIEIIKKKEAEKLFKYISEKDYLITLEIDGKQLNSVELADKIADTLIINSNLVFLIGGSYGISDELKRRSNFLLSFSKLTFPHQLFRIILLEQIYRSYKIMNNESYHK